MSKLLTILILIFLSSCSAQYHLRQAIKKDPSIIVTDTVVRMDTVYRSIERIDTIFKYNFRDTVIFVNKDSVIVKYYASYRDSIVWIDVECPDCPEITKTETITERIKVEPTFWQMVKKVFPVLLISIGLVIAILFKIFK